MLPEMQKQTYLMQFAQNKTTKSFVLRKSLHVGFYFILFFLLGGGGYSCWKLSNYLKSVLSFIRPFAPSPSVSWQHYSDEFCIAVLVMFTDQSRSVKSRIIALHNSAGIPWHVVLLGSLQAGSPAEAQTSQK